MEDICLSLGDGLLKVENIMQWDLWISVYLPHDCRDEESPDEDIQPAAVLLVEFCLVMESCGLWRMCTLTRSHWSFTTI